MTVTTWRIKDANTINQHLPATVALEQFQDGDMCTVLGVLGMDDDIVIVSPHTGLVFTVPYDYSNILVD